MAEVKVRFEPSTAAEEARLERVGTAEIVAEVLRDRILTGQVLPGTALSEIAVGGSLRVSRNTVREAFRLLCHERLAVHEFARGVFVRRLDATDIADLFQVRRLVECAAIRQCPRDARSQLDAIAAAVDRGHLAAADDDWKEVATADLQFHQLIAGLAGSPRVDELMSRTLAELRLAFAAAPDPRGFHEPYLHRNGEITGLLLKHQLSAAERALAKYLRDAETQLLASTMPARASASSVG